MMISEQSSLSSRSRSDLPQHSGIEMFGTGFRSQGRADEGTYRNKADGDQCNSQSEAEIAEALASMLAHSDAPFSRKQPSSVGEVPRCRNDSDDVGGNCPR